MQKEFNKLNHVTDCAAWCLHRVLCCSGSHAGIYAASVCGPHQADPRRTELCGLRRLLPELWRDGQTVQMRRTSAFGLWIVALHADQTHSMWDSLDRWNIMHTSWAFWPAFRILRPLDQNISHTRTIVLTAHVPEPSDHSIAHTGALGRIFAHSLALRPQHCKHQSLWTKGLDIPKPFRPQLCTQPNQYDWGPMLWDKHYACLGQWTSALPAASIESRLGSWVFAHA